MAEGAVLEARGIEKSYRQPGGDVRALKKVSLAVGAGEFAVVVGPSGSGKSTLLNVLGLMAEPDAGEILLSGTDALKASPIARARWRNKKIGFVFQFDGLLPEFTILENVLLPSLIGRSSREGASGDARARARGLLDHVGLSKTVERFPSQVSGGERQRAALCRALINGPEIILADEPTGNLDKANGEMIFKDLSELARARGAAVVMATHNDSAVGLASRVFHMQDGVLTES